jgi:hypothetical protein
MEARTKEKHNIWGPAAPRLQRRRGLGQAAIAGPPAQGM